MGQRSQGPWLEVTRHNTGALLGAEAAQLLAEENPGEWVAMRRGPDGAVTLEKLDLGEDVIAVQRILRNRCRGNGPDRICGMKELPQGRYMLVPGLHKNWFRLRAIPKQK